MPAARSSSSAWRRAWNSSDCDMTSIAYKLRVVATRRGTPRWAGVYQTIVMATTPVTAVAWQTTPTVDGRPPGATVGQSGLRGAQRPVWHRRARGLPCDRNRRQVLIEPRIQSLADAIAQEVEAEY